MSKNDWKWYHYAGLLGILAAVGYMIWSNPFKGTKGSSRGKVSTEKGISLRKLESMLSDGDKFAVGIMSDDCGHCVNFKPDFFKAKKQLGGGLKYFNATKVEDTNIFEKLSVRGFPTIVYVNKGKAVGEYSGNRKASDVVAKVGKFLKA